MSKDDDAKSADDEVPALELHPLYPKYDEDNHQIYVKQLDHALNDSEIRNIALSGPYGSGKSSVLGQFSENHQGDIVQISLASLAAGASETTSPNVEGFGEGSANKDGKDSEKSEDGEHVESDGRTSLKTNLLQKEIVKQLIYSVDPEDIPLSRFHRPSAVNRNKKSWIYSGLGSIAILLLFIEFGWYQKLLHLFPEDWIAPKNGYTSLAVNSAVLLGLFTFFGVVIKMLIEHYAGRFHLASVAFGETSASFVDDDMNDSYFDKYLDEIVYFFDETKKYIVIFEDLDRFDEPQIFDDLRELNLVLNKNINREKPIRFIYAIKDSVFPDQDYRDNKGLGSFPLAKFFDLIISVVPFVSPENASQIALKVFTGFPKFIDKVVGSTAKYIPDNRTLLNIRNEYVLYARVFQDAYSNMLSSSEDHSGQNMQREEILEQLVTSAKENDDISFNEYETGLKYSRLLGFLIYKNIFLSDIDDLQAHKSKLDCVYSAYREIVKDNCQRQQDQIKILEEKLSAYQDSSQKDYASRLAKNMKEVLSKITKQSNISLDVSYSVEGKSKSISDSGLEEIDFWEELYKLSADTLLNFSVKGVSDIGIMLTRQQLGKLMDLNLNISHFNQDECKRLENRRSELSEKRHDLLTADFEYVIKHDEYKTTIKNAQQGEIHNTQEVSLRDIVTQVSDGNSNGLIYALISNGWLAEDYILYSMVPDNLDGSAVRNFFHHYIDRNIPAYDLSLGNESAEEIVERIGEDSTYSADALFESPVMLNYDILNYLAESKTSDDFHYFSQLVKQISKMLDWQDYAFLDGYLAAEKPENESQHEMVLRALAYEDSFILFYIFDREKDNEELRLKYMNAALSNLKLGDNYLDAIGVLENDDTFIDEDQISDVSEYIQDHFGDFEFLTKDLPVQGLIDPDSLDATDVQNKSDFGLSHDNEYRMKALVTLWFQGEDNLLKPVEDLSIFSESVQDMLIANDLYEYNEKNLRYMATSDSSGLLPSLNKLKGFFNNSDYHQQMKRLFCAKDYDADTFAQDIYEMTLEPENFEKYLEWVSSNERDAFEDTGDDNELAQILADIAGTGATWETLSTALELSPEDMEIQNVADFIDNCRRRLKENELGEEQNKSEEEKSEEEDNELKNILLALFHSERAFPNGANIQYYFETLIADASAEESNLAGDILRHYYLERSSDRKIDHHSDNYQPIMENRKQIEDLLSIIENSNLSTRAKCHFAQGATHDLKKSLEDLVYTQWFIL
ncbi:hypothetical protein PT279_03020 [Bifidobacterium sp. ESL0784]|uniref:YobI family P-loop NTPase n=1 Tax=Bifidobacterium sp. ESL0784 TaxID=2983231 RepID=UPI0023F62721|nr:hypothetical protein [Bifidobacterium sp. ESL0784]MDF7640564.1 hypothetical protein [Bifidobacterium sp. ESL0784]